MVTLWLWLWLLPATVGLCVATWATCLVSVVAYLLLFNLNTAIVSIGTASATQVLAIVLNDDLMILVVTVSAHGLRQAFMAEDR